MYEFPHSSDDDSSEEEEEEVEENEVTSKERVVKGTNTGDLSDSEVKKVLAFIEKMKDREWSSKGEMCAYVVKYVLEGRTRGSAQSAIRYSKVPAIKDYYASVNSKEIEK